MRLDLTDLQPHESDGLHLTKRQAQAIESYMRDILNRLHLGHWQVHVAKDMPPEGALLMISPTEGRRIAMLYVSEGWWDRSEDHRADLVHEALHLAHHDVDANQRRFLDDFSGISQDVHNIVMSQFKTDLERMVDSLSYAIAPHMPAWNPEKKGDA